MKRGNIRRVIIAGAGGRDFENFLRFYRDSSSTDVVCFTASQIPGIEKRSFPKELAGKLYPHGIPIFSEEKLSSLIHEYHADEVVLAYSDLSHQAVMEKASMVLAAGASFSLLGPQDTMLKSRKPVVAITGVRTGVGKSQVSRYVGAFLTKHGKKIAVLRHPMPYGDLRKQEVQVFRSYDDLKRMQATTEEREEYEPWIAMGVPVYAGVDYEKILRLAEKHADIIIWDGGNNDFPFIKSDVHICVFDPHRVGHETLYYPGYVNFLMANLFVVNKVDSAEKKDIEMLRETLRTTRPGVPAIFAASAITVDRPELIRGKKVCIVGDGPTLTHGGMSFSAGSIAVKTYGGHIVDPRPYAVGSIKKMFEHFPHLKQELPAMGYSAEQLAELQTTINRCNADVVVDATPADLGRLLSVNKPIVNVGYALQEIGTKRLGNLILKMLRSR